MSDDTTTPPGVDEAAKAAAEATAQADADKAAEAKDQKAAKGRKAPALDRDQLAALAADVTNSIGVTRAQFEALADRLMKNSGLRIRTPEPGDRIFVKMAGIEASSTASARDALNNWSNAARRALNQMAA